MTTILDTPEQIEMLRFLTLRSALKLECRGMKGRTNAYATLKTQYGFKGNKQSVLKQVEEIIQQMKEGAV